MQVKYRHKKYNGKKCHVLQIEKNSKILKWQLNIKKIKIYIASVKKNDNFNIDVWG